MFDLREPSIDALRDAPIRFRYGKRRVLVDQLTASAVLACYDALTKDELKQKVARMVAGSPGQFQKVVAVAWKFARIGQ